MQLRDESKANDQNDNVFVEENNVVEYSDSEVYVDYVYVAFFDDFEKIIDDFCRRNDKVGETIWKVFISLTRLVWPRAGPFSYDFALAKTGSLP